MGVRKLATALKMLVVVHDRKNKQTNKQNPKHVTWEEEPCKIKPDAKGMRWQIGMDHCKSLQPPGW